MPESAWATITYGTTSQEAGAKASIESAIELDREPADQRRLEPEAGGEEAADEVRDDPEDLVEEEQHRDLERAVAEVVEVVEDEDAERPVGDRVGPVGAGDDRVVAQVARLPRRRAAGASAVSSLRLIWLVEASTDDLGELDEPVRVAPLVVVPGVHLRLGAGDDHRRERVDDRRSAGRSRSRR